MCVVVVFESLLSVLNKHSVLSDKVTCLLVFASLILFVSAYKLFPKTGSMKVKLILVVVVLGACFALYAAFGAGEANWRNCKKLRIFMTREQALKVMGRPKYVFTKEEYKGLSFFVYDVPMGAAEGVSIGVDDFRGQVVDIKCSGVDIKKTVDGGTVAQDYLSRWKSGK